MTAVAQDFSRPWPGGLTGAGLAIAGFLAIAAAGGLEILGIGTRGVGALQIALALAGFAFLLAREWRMAEVATRTADAGRYFTVAAELGALTLIMAAWNVEGPPLYQWLIPIAFFGFLLHHALPLALRPAFFLVVSLFAIGTIFGPADGALLVAVGLAIVGICHLPVAFGLRVVLLLAMGAAMALLRAELLPVRLPMAIWPILGSMFMFRLIVYMYDLRHGNAPPKLAQRLSYFFMLPNVVFPLYPVVDSSMYHKRYYDKEAYAIYQEGLGWIFRGVLHLLAYRLIYQRFTMAPADVANTGDLVQYCVTTFGLYLRVSGQFHLIVGLMHLFGHRLPETHRLYFLSSSFTDLWRRINIYWKDFIQKVVFLPVFFRIRARGEVYAIVLATLVAFVATWLFHSYQWFWILGKPLVTSTDVLFWTILAVLVLVNTLIERKRGRIRHLEDRFSLRESLILGLRIAPMFIAMCILWALWSSSSMEEFLSLFRALDWRSPRLYGLLAVIVGLAIVAATAARWFTSVSVRLGAGDSPKQFARQAALAGAGIAVLLVLVQPAVMARAPASAQAVLRDLRTGNLNQRDAELLARGYYENLMAVNRYNSRLWEFYAQRPEDFQVIANTAAGRETGDFFEKELVPNAEIVFNGLPFTVNRWGMRDRDYEKVPPPRTSRIALIGSSYVMASGVRAEEGFEALIEERLNRERRDGEPGYEILNFAVPGYSVIQQVLVLERRVPDFSPGVLWLHSYPHESMDNIHHVVKMVRTGVPIPWEYVRELVGAAGVTRDMSEEEAKRRLAPRHLELLAWTYRELVARCRERGIRPVLLYLPPTRSSNPEEEFREQLPIAIAAGFDIVDLTTVFEGHPLESIVVALYDSHPNAKGHRIIADRLVGQLRAHPELLRPAR